MEDIKFLREQVERERLRNYHQILNILKEKPIDNKVKFAKRFMFGVIKAAQTIKLKEKQTQPLQRQHLSTRIQGHELPPSIKEYEAPKIQPKPLPRITEPEHVKEEIKPQTKKPELKKPKTKQTIKKNQNKIILAPEKPQEPFYPKPQVAETKKHEPVDIGIESKEHPLILAGERILAKAVIGPDKETGIPKYNLIEPDVSPTQLAEIKENIKKKIEKDPKEIKNDKYLKGQVEKTLKKNNVPVTAHAYEDVKYYLWRDQLFAGKIDPLMKDKHITMITCEGVNKPVKIIFKGNTIETNLVYKIPDELNNNLVQIAKMAGKEINKQSPILDVVHGDFRIEATYGDQGVNSRYIIRRITPEVKAS